MHDLDLKRAVETLNFKQKVQRSLSLIEKVYDEYGDNERAGRWIGTSRCGGECGIHTRPLKVDADAANDRQLILAE